MYKSKTRNILQIIQVIFQRFFKLALSLPALGSIRQRVIGEEEGFSVQAREGLSGRYNSLPQQYEHPHMPEKGLRLSATI